MYTITVNVIISVTETTVTLTVS